MALRSLVYPNESWVGEVKLVSPNDNLINSPAKMAPYKFHDYCYRTLRGLSFTASNLFCGRFLYLSPLNIRLGAIICEYPRLDICEQDSICVGGVSYCNLVLLWATRRTMKETSEGEQNSIAEASIQ